MSLSNWCRAASLFPVAVAMFGIILVPTTVEACVCYLGPERCADLRTADAVFEGTVASLTPERVTRRPGELVDPWSVEGSTGAPLVVALRDVRPVRGAASTVIITAVSSASCGYTFEVGTRYLIVASRSADGRLTVTMCGLTRPLDHADGLLDYERTLTGPSFRTFVWGQVMMSPQGGSLRVGVPAARVTLSGPETRTLVTDAEGRYRIAGLPHGEYMARVELPAAQRDLGPIAPFPFTLDEGVSHACAELGFTASGKPAAWPLLVELPTTAASSPAEELHVARPKRRVSPPATLARDRCAWPPAPDAG